jgi:hypothetical protein
MALLLNQLILILIVVTPSGSFLFGRNKVLSPASNVHVDVVNHVNSALESHTHEFHHNWRDYLLILLLLGIIIFCIYRQLVAKFALRRAASMPLGITTAGPTTKY